MSASPILVASIPGLDITYAPLPAVLGISPHGILAAIGIAVGAWLLVRRLRAENPPVETAESALIWGIPAGIIGAHPGPPSAVSWMPPHRPSHWPSRSAGSATCC